MGFFLGSPSPVELFVSPNGDGDGSLTNPSNLSILDTSVPPGSTIYLDAGTYGTGGSDSFISTISGNAESPIVIKPKDGADVVIDACIIVSAGSHVHWSNVVFTNSMETRLCAFGERLGAFRIDYDVTGYKVINSVFHNCGHPVFGPTGYNGQIEVYGCVFFYNGFYDSDLVGTAQFRGSAFYGQGSASGTKLLEDCISFKNWHNGMKGWGDNLHVKNFTFRGNCCFGNEWQIFVGTANEPALNILIEECHHLSLSAFNSAGRGESMIGYIHGATGSDIIIRNNTFWSEVMDWYLSTPLSVNHWQNMQVRGNRIIASGAGARTLVNYSNQAEMPVIEWDDNKYYGNNFWAGGELNFEAWKAATGFDISSTCTDGLPSENIIDVRANKYQAGRANVIVYNHESLDTVLVDMTGVLQIGDSYIVRDVENYFEPIYSAVYDGNPIPLDMTTTAISAVIGDHQHLIDNGVLEHTPPEFGCFVVERA